MENGPIEQGGSPECSREVLQERLAHHFAKQPSLNVADWRKLASEVRFRSRGRKNEIGETEEVQRFVSIECGGQFSHFTVGDFSAGSHFFRRDECSYDGCHPDRPCLNEGLAKRLRQAAPFAFWTRKAWPEVVAELIAAVDGDGDERRVSLIAAGQRLPSQRRLTKGQR
jgi:hypothetical protein